MKLNWNWYGLFEGAWARVGRRKVPAAYNSKIVHGIDMKLVG